MPVSAEQRKKAEALMVRSANDAAAALAIHVAQLVGEGEVALSEGVVELEDALLELGDVGGEEHHVVRVARLHKVRPCPARYHVVWRTSREVVFGESAVHGLRRRAVARSGLRVGLLLP